MYLGYGPWETAVFEYGPSEQFIREVVTDSYDVSGVSIAYSYSRMRYVPAFRERSVADRIVSPTIDQLYEDGF